MDSASDSDSISPGNKPPIDSYRTVAHPEEFFLDWKVFYETAYARGQTLRASTRHAAGLKYGDDPTFVMNIFYPENIRVDAPVFVFIHGGAFQEGHPDLYDFLGERLLPEGVIFVSIGYRLAPTRFPDSARDVAQGLSWLDAYLKQDDDRPYRYCLSGHSAGASIAALLGVRPEYVEAAGLSWQTIDSLALFSGLYDFRPPEIASQFVLPERREEASPVLHAEHAPRETLLIYGYPEINVKINTPGSFKQRATLFETALVAAGHRASRLEMPDADHMQTACALEDDAVFTAVCTMLGLR